MERPQPVFEPLLSCHSIIHFTIMPHFIQDDVYLKTRGILTSHICFQFAYPCNDMQEIQKNQQICQLDLISLTSPSLFYINVPLLRRKNIGDHLRKSSNNQKHLTVSRRRILVILYLPILRVGRKDLISINLTAVFKDVAYKSRVRHQRRVNNFSFFLIWQGEKTD